MATKWMCDLLERRDPESLRGVSGHLIHPSRKACNQSFHEQMVLNKLPLNDNSTPR